MTTTKQLYADLNANSKSIKKLTDVELLQDGATSKSAVRKSQAETIAYNTTQNALINQSSASSSETTFNSETMVGFLGAKQDNMSVHSSSTNFVEIIDGTKIKINRLTTNEVAEDAVSVTLAEAIGTTCVFSTNWSCNGIPLQTGDVLILSNSTSAQERTYILNGGNSGTAADFSRMQSNYDIAEIRAMLSQGTFLLYDANSGTFSVDTGITSTQLGAQTLPVASNKFAVISNSNNNVEFALLALEALIVSVDNAASGGTTVVNQRLDSLIGLSNTNNLGTFLKGLFPDNSDIKTLLQRSEDLHFSGNQDNALIRQEQAQVKIELENALATETQNRVNSDTNITSSLETQKTKQSQDHANLTSTVNTHNQNHINAQAALDGRLDIVEGADTQQGSIAKAEADAVGSANSYTDDEITILDGKVDTEVATLRQDIANLQQGDIKLIGKILANGNVAIIPEVISAGDNRNGLAFNAIDLVPGETFIFDESMTLAFGGGGSADYEQGDKLIVLTAENGSALIESNVSIAPNNTTSLSITNLDGQTIELDSNILRVTPGSIERAQLASDVKVSLDDKRSLTENNTIVSESDVHIHTDITPDSAQNLYLKRNANTTSPLNGTKRTLLAELNVSSIGSGDSNNPAFAHTATFATHYNGNCTDLTMAIGGGNFEANVTNSSAAVYATGAYSTARSSHLGVNAGVTGVAQGAGISNIGITGFGQTGGVGKDRGGVFAIADYEFLTWAGLRALNPIPYPDAALIADAGYSSTAPAFIAEGKSILNGDLDAAGNVNFTGNSVNIPKGVLNQNAVNIQNIKDLQAVFKLNLSDGVPFTVSLVGKPSIDIEKITTEVVHEGEDVIVDISRDVGNNALILTASGDSLLNVHLFVKGYICDITDLT